jgi:hypothetical protein
VIIVNIILATICFTQTPDGPQECHNALIGSDTPRGTYTLQQRLTNDPFYGGDILQFREDPDEVYAVHRVWLGRPYEHREKRIKSPDARVRRITKGCINVEPEVYEELVHCCSRDTLIIQ